METTTREELGTLKEQLVTQDRAVSPTSETLPSTITQRRLALVSAKNDLSQIDQLDLVRPKLTGPTRYSTLFFRVLLVSAIGLTLLGMSRTQSKPAPAPFTPEISTVELQLNPQADGTSVDDPPPDVFIQPSE